METSVEKHPHAAMRRTDREITDRAEMDAIILSEKVMHLALADNNVPFGVAAASSERGPASFKVMS